MPFGINDRFPGFDVRVDRQMRPDSGRTDVAITCPFVVRLG